MMMLTFLFALAVLSSLVEVKMTALSGETVKRTSKQEDSEGEPIEIRLLYRMRREKSLSVQDVSSPVGDSLMINCLQTL